MPKLLKNVGVNVGVNVDENLNEGYNEVNIYYDGTKEEFDSILFGNNAIRSGYVLHCNNGNFNQ